MSEEFRVTVRFRDNDPEVEPSVYEFVSMAHVESWLSAMEATMPVDVERIESCEVTRTPWVEVARESAPAPDPHVSYVPGEDPGIAALREMVNGNRELLGIDGEGGGEEQ